MGSVVMAPRLSCSAAREIFPDQELNPCLPHWQAESLSQSHQGSPQLGFYQITITARHARPWSRGSRGNPGKDKCDLDQITGVGVSKYTLKAQPVGLARRPHEKMRTPAFSFDLTGSIEGAAGP